MKKLRALTILGTLLSGITGCHCGSTCQQPAPVVTYANPCQRAIPAAPALVRLP